MSEQATSSTQIASGTQNLKLQSEQTARALIEQSRAVKDISTSTQNVSKQIRLITDANRMHSQGARGLAENLESIREVVLANLSDAKSMHAASTALYQRETSSDNGVHNDLGRNQGKKRRRVTETAVRGAAPAKKSRSSRKKA
jgi:predicted metalloendopeptidase